MAEAQEAKGSRGPDVQTFHIGTRKSTLALVQTDEVVKYLRLAWPHYHFEIHSMSTTGDNNQSTALHKFNDKALWTQELEVLLQDNKLDLIVHSLKDMPTQLPVDLDLGCVLKREDARDALVVKPSLTADFRGLGQLPEGSVVGTSSLRRTAQLKRHYPHLKFADVRGNIGTRLSKLDNPDSEYSAIVLAAAGLSRLGMNSRITTYLTKDDGGMLHAVGQGALGIEIRKGDARVAKLLSKIGCERTTLAVLAERSLMRTLEGGCSVPIGVETSWVPRKDTLDTGAGVGIKPAAEYDDATGVAKPTTIEPTGEELTDELVMHAVVVSLDGQDAVVAESRRPIVNRDDAEEFGFVLAGQLVKKGADKILKGITLNRDIIHKQGDA